MRIVFWLIAGIFFTSCIGNKKVTLLQKDDLHKKNLPKDSTVRSYSSVPAEYRIQPQDALYIDIKSSKEDEDFNFLENMQGTGNSNVANPGTIIINSELVDNQGEISFPVVGKIKVSGLTVFEVQDKLQVMANQYLNASHVKVRLVNFRVTVLGEVLKEGQVTSFNNRVTLPEVIGLAGGLGELADRSNIKILRQQSGVTEVAYVNLLDESIINSPYYFMNQNDVLIVPPLKQRPFRKYFGQNFSIILSSVSVILLIINLNK